MRHQSYFCAICGCVGEVTYRAGIRPSVLTVMVEQDHQRKVPQCAERPALLRVLVDRPAARAVAS